MTSKYSFVVGAPPGAARHTAGTTGQSILTLITYNDSEFEEKALSSADELPEFPLPNRVSWLHISGLGGAETLAAIQDKFSIHPLIMEDALNPTHRPKAELQEDTAFICIKKLSASAMAQGAGHSGAVQQFSMVLILSKNILITFSENTTDFLAPLVDRIRTQKGRIRSCSTGYLTYAILDYIVDHYFLVLEQLSERLDALEVGITKHLSNELLFKIHSIKREMLAVKKAIWPVRELVSILMRDGEEFMGRDTTRFLRDLYDHVVQIIDTIETQRDEASGLLDLYISGVSNRMNSVMQVLTIIATIFIPLTFIAGIYGMNFEHMPELHWKWGYPAVITAMAAIAAAMLLYFKKKKWL